MTLLGYIYIILFPNGKAYIGQTRNWDKRMGAHKRDTKTGKDKCPALAAAIRKYGWPGAEVLLRCPFDELNENEAAAIRSKGTLAPGGYNLILGGGVPEHCEETKNKRRKSNAQYWESIRGPRDELQTRAVEMWDDGDGMNGYQIADVLNISQSLALALLREAGINTSGKDRRENLKARIVELWDDGEGMNTVQISDVCHTARSYIYVVLREAGIDISRKDRENLKARAVALWDGGKGMNGVKIAAVLDICATKVYTLLREAGIDTSNRITADDIDEMVRLRGEGLSCDAIAAQVGCSGVTVWKYLQTRGIETSPNTKLTPDQVREIRKYLEEGILTKRTIGKKFDVTERAIYDIKRGRSWTHITLEPQPS